MENSGKNGRFSGLIWPDWGNTAWADMVGLGSIGLRKGYVPCHYIATPPCRLSPSPMSHISNLRNGHVSLWILGVKGHVISSFNSSSLPQALSTAPSHLQVLPIPLPFWPLPILLTGLATFSCGRMFQLVQALQATYTL